MIKRKSKAPPRVFYRLIIGTIAVQPVAAFFKTDIKDSREFSDITEKKKIWNSWHFAAGLCRKWHQLLMPF